MTSQEDFFMDNVKRFTFRLPTELFDKVEAVAKENHRSVNAEVIVAIEQYLQSIETPLQSDND